MSQNPGLLGSLSFMTTSAQLPPVDSEFLVVERRPAMLHAYARGLLQQLRGIRADEEAEGWCDLFRCQFRLNCR